MFNHVLAIVGDHAYVTTGGQIIIALVTALGSIQVALIMSTNRNAKKAANLAEPTGNGYAKETTASLRQLERSLGALHGRMDERERYSTEARDEVREVLVNFDNRLTHIEEKLS